MCLQSGSSLEMMVLAHALHRWRAPQETGTPSRISKSAWHIIITAAAATQAKGWKETVYFSPDKKQAFRFKLGQQKVIREEWPKDPHTERKRATQHQPTMNHMELLKLK